MKKNNIFQRILAKDLHLHSFKIQLTQKLQPTYYRQRRDFTNWILEQLPVNGVFHNKIIFSDEAYFHLNNFINKQSPRIRRAENPHALQLPTYLHNMTIWCASASVNGDRYRGMLTNVTQMQFQRDSATCRTACKAMTLLQTKFPDRASSRFGNQNWQTSYDLICLDFFLCFFLSKVYVKYLETIQELQEEVERQTHKMKIKNNYFALLK